MKVKFVDLSAQHKTLETEIKEVFHRVLANCSFVLGPEVDKFEKAFASYCGVAHCIAVSNGTAALQLVLQGLGVGPGDEVITVAHTFIATAEAINATGARPVFVDIDAVSYTMDPTKLEAAITPRTKAIIPVLLKCGERLYDTVQGGESGGAGRLSRLGTSAAGIPAFILRFHVGVGLSDSACLSNDGE